MDTHTTHNDMATAATAASNTRTHHHMSDRLHHLLPLLKITPTRALGNDETPRRASEKTVEDVLEEYRRFSKRRIPTDRESAEYFRFDEDVSIMLFRLRQFVGTSMLESLEELLYEAIGQLEELARVLSGVDGRRKQRAPPEAVSTVHQGA